MLRRIGRGLRIVGFTSFALTVFVLVSLYALSYAAPPMLDERPVDYDAEPSIVVENTMHNLRTAEYAYSMTITETNVSTGEQELVREQYTEIDNGAQIYYSEVQSGDLKNEGYPPVQYYGNGFSGYKRVPEGVTVGFSVFGSGGSGEWESDSSYPYIPLWNAFEDLSRLQGAETTVVSRNETTYVARVTNDSVAAAVAYEHRYGLSTKNKQVNLTVSIDTRTNSVTNAILEYRGPETEGRVEYEFSRHGSVHVSRPMGAYPPDPRNVLERLDVGIRALTSPLSLGGGLAW